jgi:DNA-binding CsgD family transcriptional regulator
VCRSGQRGRAFLTVTRRAASGAFESSHQRLLDAIAPHVAAGVHAATIQASLAAAPASAIGTIVLERDGKVQLANTAGERWLARVDVKGRSGYSWAAHLLAHLLTRGLAAEGAATVPVLEVNDPVGGTAHRLHAERVRDANGDWRAMVLVEPVGVAESPSALVRLGLTEREAVVALGLLRGGTVATLADELGCSPHTVVHHLRRVFDKLGVSSRRELLAALYAGFARVKVEPVQENGPPDLPSAG